MQDTKKELMEGNTTQFEKVCGNFIEEEASELSITWSILLCPVVSGGRKGILKQGSILCKDMKE